jgi:hypothetical protein
MESPNIHCIGEAGHAGRRIVAVCWHRGLIFDCRGVLLSLVLEALGHKDAAPDGDHGNKCDDSHNPYHNFKQRAAPGPDCRVPHAVQNPAPCAMGFPQLAQN